MLKYRDELLVDLGNLKLDQGLVLASMNIVSLFTIFLIAVVTTFNVKRSEFERKTSGREIVGETFKNRSLRETL